MDLEANRHRASRRERVKGRGARLRDRDIDILFALSKMRLLRTSDLTRLFFSAKGTCQKRLRKLYDAGLVRAVVTDLAAENRYALTKLGHALVEEAMDDGVVPPYRPPPKIDGRNVIHLDLLNGYRVALAEGTARHGLELRAFLPDWELRARDPLATLVPDALVTLAWGGAVGPEIVFALEVDTGTEAAPVVLKKLEKYREREALGQVVFGLRPKVVVIVTATERRARTLARRIVASGGGASAPRVLLGATSGLEGDGGLTAGLSFSDEVAGLNGEGGHRFRRGLLGRGA